MFKNLKKVYIKNHKLYKIIFTCLSVNKFVVRCAIITFNYQSVWGLGSGK